MLADLGNGRFSLTIVGDATIAHAAELRERLVAAVTAADHIDLDVDASSVDLSSIQLLLSACKSLRDRGGRLSLARPPTGALLAALTRGGFMHSAAQDGLWSSYEDHTHR